MQIIQKRRNVRQYKKNYQTTLERSNFNFGVRCKEIQTKKTVRKFAYIATFHNSNNCRYRFISLVNLLHLHFNTTHQYYEIINRKCLKTSYSCTPIIKAKIIKTNKYKINWKVFKTTRKRIKCMYSIVAISDPFGFAK